MLILEEIILTIIIEETYNIQKLKMEDGDNNGQLSQFENEFYSGFVN